MGRLAAPGAKVETGGVAVAPAQVDDGLDERKQGANLGGGMEVRRNAGPAQNEGQAVGDGFGEKLGHRGAAGGDLEFVLVGREFGDVAEKVLAGEPFLVAAVAPLREVLGRDGAAVEAFREDGSDFGQRVEPLEDGGGLETFFQAGVELGADRAGEAGDFTDTGHNNVVFLFHR